MEAQINVVWIVICAGLVFFMQAGFTCLESGLTRSKNSINVAIKNIADFGLSACLFWAFGFAVMFGDSFRGLLGWSGFCYPVEDHDSFEAAFFLFQLMFCGTAVTVVSGAVAERTRFIGYLVIVLLLTGLVYPVFGHWAWCLETHGGLGWLREAGFVDFAGSTVVHSVGGWVALAAVTIIGPREGRFPENGEARKIQGHSLPMAVLGTLILWFGWLGFNGGGTYAVTELVPGILARTVLAGASGLVTAMAIGWLLRRDFDVGLTINGALAGLVSITAGCHAVSSSSSILIGAIGAGIMVFVSRMLERARIDDVVGAIPVHAGAGVWGTLAVALFGEADLSGSELDRMGQFRIQALGVLVCFAWSFSIAYVCLWLINRRIPLRVTPQQERAGLNVSEHGASTELFELFQALDTQAKTADIRMRAPVEPFTEVGQIAALYNRVLDALQQAEERFRTAVFAAPNAMLLVNQTGEILLANPQAETLFGFPREQLAGENIDRLIPSSLRAPHQKHLANYFAEPRPRLMNAHRELLGVRRDGAEIPLEIGLSPVFTEGEVLALSSMIDISHRKEAERALREARDAAVAASRAKSEFVAHMSHEIRTPMNGVMGMLELLAHGPVDQKQGEQIRLAKLSAESLLQILNDILDFSKIEAGKLELEHVGFRLRDLVGDTLHMMQLSASEQQLELACHIAPDVADGLIGDPLRLRQILVNLVGNALKFTPAGEVVVHVETLSTSDTVTRLKFSVKDTGIGIPRERQHQIFEAFGQADSSTTREFGGTGLGLSISRQLVGLMDGELGLESREGFGSTFFFSAEFELSPALADPSLAAQPALTGFRVLVVDDNATNRHVLKELLSLWNLESVCVENGAAALAELDRCQDFQVVLLDMMMPKMDGWMLAKEIRADARLEGLPLLMLTSAASSEDEERCLELGIQGQLCKPIKQGDLLDAILNCLQQPQNVSRSNDNLAVPFQTPLRILLAEDGLINQKVAAGLLEACGHRVFVVSNGAQAVQAATAENFDLILMDIEMPSLDGIEATIRIREAEASTDRHVPIVAMTAHAIKGDRERFLAAGMDGYLPKPVNPGLLHQTIAELTETSPPPPSPVPEPETRRSEVASVLDLDEARSRIPGGENSLRDVAELLSTEGPRLCKVIREAYQHHDSERLRREAHTLKSSADIFGATKVTELARTVESLAREQKLDDLVPLLDELAEAVDELAQALSRVGTNHESSE